MARLSRSGQIIGYRVGRRDPAGRDELVGHGEEDYDNGRILASSPLAQGLVGKKVGQQAEIEVPAGTMRFEIVKITFEE